MRRQKRKADSLQLNFVQSTPLKRKYVSFKKVSYPINTGLSINNKKESSSDPTAICKPTTFFIKSLTGIELEDDDMYDHADTGPLVLRLRLRKTTQTER